jgi:hypothetical protein
MRKIMLTLGALMAFGWANAQISTNAGTFEKPKEGTFIMEVNATPDLTGGGIFSLPSISGSLDMVGVKMRDFRSANKAYRYGANFALNDDDLPNTDTEFAVGLSLGIERHLKGAERLSTYWGYEVSAAFAHFNAYGDDEYGDSYYYNYQVDRLGVGVGAFCGFDYYIIPKVYVGTEMGYNAALVMTNPDEGSNRTTFELAPGINPVLRVGWQF